MPGEDRIDSIIDIPAIRAEYDELVKMLNSLGVAIKNAGNAEGLKNPSIGIKEMRAESEKAVKTMETLATSVDKVVKADERYVAVAKFHLDAQAEMVSTNKVVSSSYDQLFRQLAKNRMEMSELQSKHSDLQKAIDNGKISYKAYTEALLNIEKRMSQLSYSNQQINRAIRNFNKESQTGTGSLNQYRAQLSLLLQTYDNLSQEERNSAMGQGIKKTIDDLTKQVKQMEQETGRFGRNVGNYTGSIKILEKALQDVTKKIDEFTRSGRENRDVLEELRREQSLLQKLVDSQAAGFASLSAELKANEQALQDLKAAGKEDTAMYQELLEKIAKAKDELKSFTKEIATRGSGELYLEGMIQAAQTLAGIYGIAQGAAALFGDENEELQKTFLKLQAVMTILNGLEAINNALKKENALRTSINVGLQKLSVLQTNLQTAAESKNIVVKYAAVAAQKALNFAMSSAGGPLLILIGLLALASTAFAGYSKKAEDAAAKNELLKRGLKDYIKTREESERFLKRESEKEIASLEANFAKEEEIRQARIRGMQKELENQREFNEISAKEREKAIKHAEKLTFRLNQSEDEKKEAREAREIAEEYLKEVEREKELEHAIEIERLRNMRDAKEEAIRIRQDELELLKLQLQEQAAIQQAIASDENKSLNERIAAMQQFSKLQQQIFSVDAQKQLITPGLTPSQIKVIEKQRAVAIAQVRRDNNKRMEDLSKEYAERERRAQFDIIRTTIEQRQAAALRIANDENKSYDERIAAAADYLKAQEELIRGQMNLELQNAALTATERKAIEEKANADLLKSRQEFMDRSRQILLQNLDEEARRRVLAVEKERDEMITALNKQYHQGLISLAEFNRRRLELEKKYTKEALNVEIENVKKLLEEYKKLSINTAELEARLADLQKRLSDEVTNKKIDNLNKLRALERQVAGEIMNLVSTLVSAGYDRELNKIQEQIDANEDLKAKEVERINSSLLSEEEKAAKLAQLESRSAVQREQLERRQREVQTRQARFERDRAILEIVANTAIAIMKAVKEFPLTGGMPFAAINAAIGAVQIATLLAKPLPKFAEGTDSAPEGPAVVGERGRELIITPDGKLSYTPPKATIMWLEKGTRIVPNHELNKMQHAGMMQSLNLMMNGATGGMTLKKLDEVKDAVLWLGGEFHKSTRKIKPTRVVVQDMGGWKAHIQKQVFE